MLCRLQKPADAHFAKLLILRDALARNASRIFYVDSDTLMNTAVKGGVTGLPNVFDDALVSQRRWWWLAAREWLAQISKCVGRRGR